MATIKITRVKASMPDSRNRITGRYIKYYTFKTFIDNKGNKTYFLNGEETTMDEGNEVFKNIMKSGEDIEREDTKEDLTYQEVIDRLMKGYDEYVQYIDDPKQYEEACRSNKKILEKVNKIRDLMEDEAN